MSELDVVKEHISFLAQLFFVGIGIIVVTISGLVSLVIGNAEEHIPLFWFGAAVVLICAVACLKIFVRINHYIEKLKKL